MVDMHNIFQINNKNYNINYIDCLIGLNFCLHLHNFYLDIIFLMLIYLIQLNLERHVQDKL